MRPIHSRLRLLLAVLLVIAWAPRARAEDQELPPEPEPMPKAPPAKAPKTEAAVSTTAPLIVFGLGAGAFIPTSKLGVNFLVGIDGSFQLPFLARKFGVGVGIGYSQPTTLGQVIDERVPGGASVDYSSTMREVLLDLRMSFRVFSWESVWSPHIAIGPAFYFLSHQVVALEHSQTETSTQVGFCAIVGADYRIWRGAVIGEVRIPFATVGQKTTGSSNVGAASVIFGYRFRL